MANWLNKKDGWAGPQAETGLAVWCMEKYIDINLTPKTKDVGFVTRIPPIKIVVEYEAADWDGIGTRIVQGSTLFDKFI